MAAIRESFKIKMRRSGTGGWVVAVIVVLSLIGGAIAVYTTENGPWGYTDPVEYISVARHLDRGQGLTYYEGNGQLTAETIHPPLYSLVLAFIGLFGADLVAASRWLNILALIASIFIGGWIFMRYSPVPVLGIAASAVLCAFPYVHVFFASSYSEPLFVLSILLGGWGLLAYLHDEKASKLILGALAVSTIPGTRYAGLAMVAAAGLTVFLFASGRAWGRIKKAAAFTLLSALPVLAWLGWVYFSAGHSVGGRQTGIQMTTILDQFQTFRGVFMDTVWKWVPFQTHETLLGYRLRFIMMGILALILVGLSTAAWRRLKRTASLDLAHSGMQIFTFFGLSAVIFVAVLILTYLFTQPTIDIDNRMLLPLFACCVMMIYGAFALWQAAWFTGGLRVLQAVPLLLAATCVAWYIPQTWEKVLQYHPGDGLTMYRWRDSSLIQAVRELPEEQPVISNDWELTMLWTGKPVHGLWTTFPTELPLQSTPYGTVQADPNQAIFCPEGAALVIYTDFPTQVRSQIGEAALLHLTDLFAGLRVQGEYPDGTIYLCGEKQ